MARSERLMTEDGVALLFYRIELPEPSGERERALLEEILTRAVSYLEGEVTEALRREYLASEHPKRRFTFRRAEYRLTVRRGEDGHLTARLCFSRGGKVLMEGDERLTVLADGRLFPLAVNGKTNTRKSRKEQKQKKRENMLVIRG